MYYAPVRTPGLPRTLNRRQHRAAPQKEAVRVFFAIGDPTRRQMLDMLRVSEHSAGELARPFSVSQPAISQHLRVLRLAGLVSVRRNGRERRYRLRARRLREVYDWIAHYEQFWEQKLKSLGEYLDRGEDGESS
jgi:DNA-binding transcriptional ArsR family regulator